MLDRAIAFVRKNMKTKTIIHPDSGRREDRTEYPVTAVREVILNTLVHRDYSVHTEGMPIQLLMFPDRLEIRNPGGIYGRIRIDQLGKMQPDTRNPVLATALEVMGLTENRYSGIPTIRRAMEEAGLKEPVFADERGTFSVTLFNTPKEACHDAAPLTPAEQELLTFLETPRTRQEIADHLGIETISYALQAYVAPLIRSGMVEMTIPETPRSHKQRYVRCRSARQ